MKQGWGVCRPQDFTMPPACGWEKAKAVKVLRNKNDDLFFRNRYVYGIKIEKLETESK